MAPGPQDELQGEIVGSSAAFATALAQIRRVAASEAPVLIEGETGCGKELAARAVHYWGVRSNGPFVPVNCGALPDHLLEAELFGHERGAFTDAKLARRGLVAEAHGGTLFLDEVDALSTKAQITLLRFLQDQRYRPLGSSRELSSNARLVAATNQPLADATQQGRFRCDLMYRLKILHIELPPLRERTGDAEQLAQHFVAQLCAKYRLPLRRFDPSTLAWIRDHAWPGNVRELENWVHREVLMADGLTIHAALDPTTFEHSTVDACGIDNFRRAKAVAVRQFERDYLLAVMRQTSGNVTRAALIAGKERRAFGKLIKKHGIDRRALGDS
ncbi:MAG: sigma-54-dependent Fis family transcriptional regulator [Burkholderiales bacterium]|nr:sigma-54-dependent Fis family transcriptional regulator [Burkholderiales bacterium]MDE2298125.1 sigma-54-dependent Fis family transcriptional regulator [Burkholderiales bacterium]MDE2628660.1 sigma-54-dependent Fis family transcriptional regulator [Burkholderiales bacterium]